MLINFIKKWYITNLLYVYLVFIQQFLLLQLFKIKCFFLKINLKNKKHLTEKYKKHNKKVCHIIGSGYSLNYSKKHINKNDFVIGFNFAALEKLDFDLYFFEFAGKKCEEISNRQNKVLQNFISNKKNHLYFKNILLPRNNIDFLYDLYGDDINIIEDIILKNRSLVTLNSIFNMIFNTKSNFFRQYNSSLFFCIDVAKAIGFKTIIFHGVDFKGPYFFEKSPPEDFFDENHYKKRGAEENHVINNTSYGLEGFLSFIISKMKNEISFFCASDKTPLIRHLKNFYAN